MATSTRVKINFFAETQQALGSINAIYQKTKMLTTGVGQFGRSLTGFGETMTRNVTLPITAGLGVAAKQALEFDKELMGASRALDFTDSQAKEFAKTAKTIAPSLGLAPAKFLELSTAAGRLGVAREDVVGFAKNITELGFATDTSTTFLAEKFAAIRSVFGSTNQDLKILGASINSLDDKIGGTTRDITKFTARLAGVGKVAGFNSSEVAALGSTFLKLGVNVSAAGSGANTMLLHLASATSLSKKAQNGFKALGLSAQQVEEMMRTDPKKGLLQFLQIANNFKGDKLGTLNAIFGKQHGFKIVSLAESYHELGRAFGVVGNQSAALAKLQSETDKRLNSNAGQIAIFKAQMSALAITIGTAILPALNSLLKSITPLIVKFAKFAEANPQLVEMGVIVAGLTATIGPLLIAIGSVISAVSAIAPVVAAVGGGLAAVGGFIAKIAGMIPIVKAVGAAVGGVISAIAAFTGAPVALVVAAIAAIAGGAWWIYSNWNNLGKWFGDFGRWFGGFWENLSSKFGGAFGEMWKTLTLFIKNPIAGLIRAFGQVLNASLTIAEWLAPNIGKGLQMAGQFIVNYYKFWWDVWTNKLPQGVYYGLNETSKFLRWFFTDSLPNFLNNVGKWFFNAGKFLMITFANGIRSQVHDALAPIIEFTNRVRSYLPSSDAKMGALSELTASGKALFSTVADGVDPTALINAVIHGVNATREALQFNPLPANNTNNNFNSSQPVVLNFNPTINADGNTDGRDIVEQLRPFARELIDMLIRNNSRLTRSAF